jgi:hypothetical protein
MVPANLARLGFMDQNQVLHRKGSFLPMTVGLHGKPSEGKTEFALGSPGLIAGITVDRGHVGMMLNPKPPATRNPNTLWKVIDPPMVSAAKQEEFTTYWVSIRSAHYDVIAMPEVRTVLSDGDSDGWEIQRMSAFGKLTQVPSHLYVGVNAERRAYYARLTDSGKFLVFTNKMTKEYVTVYNAITGQPEVNDKGQPVRRWSGRWERKGFDDLDYSLQVSLECYREGAKYDDQGNLIEAGEFAARIELCKANKQLEGDVLSGQDCNMRSMLQHVYPHIPLSQWGY